MAWTYDSSKFNDATVSANYPPATLGSLNQVRFLIQDTSTARQLLQDDEIYWVVTQEANPYMAAAACCDTLVAKAGSIKSKKISALMITYDVAFYTRLSATLRARGMCHQTIYAGGISIADKLAQASNPDWVQPAISRGLDENPTAPGPSVIISNPLTVI